MAYDGARSELVVFGTAYSSSEFSTGLALPASPTAETWAWRDGKWTKLAPSTSPPPRTWAGMAYDEARRQVVLFGGGGRGQPFLGDTWTWDGRTWSQKTPKTSPPAAGGAILAYHAKLGRIVALVDVAADVTQTWTWDGTTWVQLHPSIELQGRRFATAAAYDPARGSLVVFGRDVFDGNGDTWTFDGQTWARHLAALGGPTGRVGATMAYDPSAGNLVMFGGAGGPGLAAGKSGGTIGDTWTWDGSVWTESHPPDSPAARAYAAGGTDTVRGQVVLYGGIVFGAAFAFNYSDVWTWAHGSWTLVQPTTIPAPPDELDPILKAASLGTGLRPSCTASSPPCMSVHGQPQIGVYAAYVLFDLTPPQGANALCISYVSFVAKGDTARALASGPWHTVGVVCGPSAGGMLQLGSRAQVAVTGCANVRAYPQTGQVVSCLRNGTPVTIDDGPIATTSDSKRLWWHLEKRGWMAHELLAGAGSE